ncbi:hypothetical protein K490DRAFT_4044, partial [Saccharata proteae CBS 121410]
SPTADLLRGSRVFSLPPPLPRPDTGTTGSTSTFSNSSPTATQHYPTYQAVATPASSLHRGDWGFKRPLPLKATTRSSTPTMRIKEIDTIEHFTEFESAGDHVKTLEKWNELGIPISVRDKRRTISGQRAPHVSVFEDAADNTRLNKQDRENKAKWKYDGPWIGGMNAGEFDYFLKHRVRSRKLEFRQFLRDLFSQRAYSKKIAELDKEGLREELNELKVEDCRLTDAEFEEQLKAVRKDTTLSSEISHAISEFFDLPGASESESSSNTGRLIAGALGDTDKGPPRTHPSAGLSYLRSDALMENHPVLGPRENPTPVEGRILMSKTSADLRSYGRVGVAGIVAKLDMPMTASKSTSLKSSSFKDFGGPKVWVTVERASIDSHGRVELSIKPAVPEDVDIKQGRL